MIQDFINIAINIMTHKLARDWIKLAKRDLKRIKKKTRMSLDDAYTIGRIEAELISMENDIEEVQMTEYQRGNQDA